MITSVFRQIIAVGILFLGLTGTASAQNYDGNGIVRFGVFGGGEFYDLKRSPNTVGTTSMDGATVGFAAGYDLIFARQIVLGIEGDVTVGDTGGTLNDVGIKTHADYLATLRGRLGVFLTPDFLVYGTGGVAWAGLGIEDTGIILGIAADSNKTAVGWVAGGGLEYDLRDYFGTIIFGEYLFGSFETWKNLPGLGFDVDAEVQTFRVGVKFKLGHDYHDDILGRRYEPMK